MLQYYFALQKYSFILNYIKGYLIKNVNLLSWSLF